MSANRLARRLPAGAAWVLGTLAIAELASVTLITGSGPLGTAYACKALVAFAVATGWFWRRLPLHDHPAYGPANAVTHLRVAITAALAGLIGEAAAAPGALVTAAAVIAVLLDALDGALARRSDCASAFGAWFDMETDALLIVVLAALCWQFSRAGPWVLASGLLRYGFVAASYRWPWLAAALPASARRRFICVVQSVCLIACLAPNVGPPLSELLAAFGLLLLAASFAIDVAWLAGRRVRPVVPAR